MSVSRRSRRAAAVGLGALALALTGGPALAAVPSSDVTAPPVVADVEQAVSDAAATAEKAVAPAPPVPAAPAPAPAPAAPPPPSSVSPPAKKAPAAPVETVTTVVNTLVTVVLGQLDARPAPPTAPAPAGGAPVVQSGAPAVEVPVAAPAQPARRPAVSAAVREANEAVEAIADAALSGTLGAFARDIAGDLPAGELALAGPASDAASPLTLSEMLAPSVAPAEGFLPSGRSGSGQAVPALLVAVAALAVGLSAVGNGVEIRRRR